MDALGIDRFPILGISQGGPVAVVLELVPACEQAIGDLVFAAAQVVAEFLGDSFEDGFAGLAQRREACPESFDGEVGGVA